ncbi:hypothetical protein COCNU_15G006170 [Cocos nucifera]|uniref:Uncharacterized protein n=1 Tax=Cocos nucifera TaxID=13894 RepID=A0A8K0IXS2_COCNU|nr:hypothetical protein COCNU_15G006170 [Cocos nucifera]
MRGVIGDGREGFSGVRIEERRGERKEWWDGGREEREGSDGGEMKEVRRGRASMVVGQRIARALVVSVVVGWRRGRVLMVSRWKKVGEGGLRRWRDEGEEGLQWWQNGGREERKGSNGGRTEEREGSDGTEEGEEGLR